MKRDILSGLKKSILAGDSAMGTVLQGLGLPAGESPERWNLDYPDKIKSVHRMCVEAGSDIIITNTFGGNRWKLEKARIDEGVDEINKKAVEIAREAAGDDIIILGDIGPTGEFVYPLGTYKAEEFRAVFREQIKALVKAGVDGIILETMISLEEAGEAVLASRDVSDKPLIASMTFDKGAKGFRTIMGVSPEDAAVFMEEKGVDIIGTNCGGGIEDACSVVSLMRKASSLPIMAQPNAGRPELVKGNTVFRETAKIWRQHIKQLVENGANIIGGCCGTTAEHINVIKEFVETLRATSLR